MALTPSRTDLQISLVGADDTAQMLADAQANMAKLEGRLNSLKKAGDSQASSARSSLGPLDAVKARMTGLAGVADKAVSGLDKIKGTFDKVLGVAAFAAPVFAGVTAGVLALADAFFSGTQRLEGLDLELANADRRAHSLTQTMGSLKDALNAATVASGVQDTGMAALRARMLAAQGDAEGAAVAQKEAAVEAIRAGAAAFDKEIGEITALRSARSAEQRDAAAGIARVKTAQRELNDDTLKAQQAARKGSISDLSALAASADKRKALAAALGMELAKHQDIKDDADELLGVYDAQVLKLREKKNMIEQTAQAVKTAADPAEVKGPKGPGSTRMALVEEESATIEDAMRQEIEDREQLATLRRDVFDEEKSIALESMTLLAKAASARQDATAKELAAGKSKSQAQMESAKSLVSNAALAIGGVRAEAAVQALYEGAAAVASFASFDYLGGGLHVLAAAQFGAVALTGPPKGGGSGGGASRGASTIGNTVGGGGGGSSGGGGGGPTINNYNMTTGVADGQSTTRAFRRAEQQSRGTGFAQAGGW